MDKEILASLLEFSLGTVDHLIAADGLVNVCSMALERHLPRDQYGCGKAKQWRQLLQEIELGESKICLENGRPIRLVNVALLDVFYQGSHLVELYQRFTDGRIRRRGIRGISEKLEPGESWLDAVMRGLRQELGISCQLHPMTKDFELDEQMSPSYPGLLTRYIKQRYQVQLPDEAYKPIYLEVQESKTTVWGWRHGRYLPVIPWRSELVLLQGNALVGDIDCYQSPSVWRFGAALVLSDPFEIDCIIKPGTWHELISVVDAIAIMESGGIKMGEPLLLREGWFRRSEQLHGPPVEKVNEPSRYIPRFYFN